MNLERDVNYQQRNASYQADMANVRMRHIEYLKKRQQIKREWFAKIVASIRKEK